MQSFLAAVRNLPPQISAQAKMPAPQEAELAMFLEETPKAALTFTFARVADAVAAAKRWPAFKRELTSNPVVLISGFAHLVSSAQVDQKGEDVVLTLSPSYADLVRLLRIAEGLAVRR